MATRKTEDRPKRYRATNAEMADRENTVFDALRAAGGPLTIEALAETIDLPYAKTAALIRRLTDSGRVTMLGREGRQILFAPAEGAKAVERPQPAPKVRPLPAVDVNSILNQVHLGDNVEVVGFRIQKDADPVIDLRSPDGSTLTVSIVS
jgi:hypothetical protein